MLKWLTEFQAGRKTLTAVVGLICTGIGGYLLGDLSLVEALTLVLNGLGIGGLRLAKGPVA